MFLLRSNFFRLALVLLLLLALLLFYPVRTGILRSAIVATTLAIEICLLLALWRKRWLRWLPLLPALVVTGALLLPGRPADKTALRAAYLRALTHYDGCRYVWGGESWRGVDCSGLLRAALIDAHLAESLRTLNPALARQALDFWWHDASAADMSDGYRGNTAQLPALPAKPLQDLTGLAPGDLAVTADGSHVLAYLGDARWIEADPFTNRVMQLSPETPSSWFQTKVIPCRWKCLTN